MRKDLEELKKIISPIPKFPVEPLGLPELDKLERKSSPDMFIKIERYEDILDNFKRLKETVSDINGILDLKMNAIKLLQQGMKNFENILSKFDETFASTNYSTRYIKEQETDVMRNQIESLEKELARLKTELESKNI